MIALPHWHRTNSRIRRPYGRLQPPDLNQCRLAVPVIPNLPSLAVTNRVVVDEQRILCGIAIRVWGVFNLFLVNKTQPIVLPVVVTDSTAVRSDRGQIHSGGAAT